MVNNQIPRYYDRIIRVDIVDRTLEYSDGQMIATDLNSEAMFREMQQIATTA